MSLPEAAGGLGGVTSVGLAPVPSKGTGVVLEEFDESGAGALGPLPNFPEAKSLKKREACAITKT